MKLSIEAIYQNEILTRDDWAIEQEQSISWLEINCYSKTISIIYSFFVDK